MNQGSVLVLPGGRWQVPLLQRVAELGYRPVTVNPLQNSPGFAVAHSHLRSDVLDVDAVLEFAESHEVVAAITDQSDIAVRTVATIADHLGLPGLGVERSTLFTDKAAMRDHVRALGLPTPLYLVLDRGTTTAEVADRVGFPLVVKPVDGQASRGVTAVGDADALPAAVHAALRASRSGRAIAEQLIIGPEITVEGVVVDGKYVYLASSRKRHRSSDAMVADSIVYRHTHEGLPIATAIEHVSKFIESTGVQFGLSHAELRCSDEGVYLVDVAARGGGNLISSHVVPAATGVATMDMLIESALGHRTRPPKIEPRPGLVAVVWFEFDGGTVFRLEGREEARRISDVLAFDFLAGVGDVIGPPKEDSTRHAYAIISAPNDARLEELILEIRGSLDVEVVAT